MTLTAAQDVIARLAPEDYYVKAYRAMEADYLPHICAEVAELPPGQALDIGPGWGTMMVWLSSVGWRVTGMDIMPFGHYIRWGLLHETKSRYAQADICRGHLYGRRYDLVLMTQVIPHLRWAPVQAVRNAAKMLKAGGTFVTTALDVAVYPHVEAAYGTDWRAVPEYEKAEPTPDMVTCMYSAESFAEMLGEVFPNVTVGKPAASTVLLASARTPARS